MARNTKPAPKADTKPAPKADTKPAPKADTKPAPTVTAKPARPVVKVEAARNCAPTCKLEWLVKANPKRPGSASHARAELYWGKTTVADYLAAGGERVDLSWDADHGFVALKP